MKYSKETNKIIQDIGLDEKNDCNNHQHKWTKIPEPPKEVINPAVL